MRKILIVILLCGFVTSNVMGAEPVFKPGVYKGAANGRNGLVEVEVTVDKNRIKSVDVINHKETKSISTAAIETVPKAIIEDQSLAVDAVSGASLTSNAIIAATEDALKKSGADMSLLMVAKKKSIPKAKDITADVVVVGAGSAGMIAAIEAGKAGLKVVLVEKQGMFGGGDSMLLSTGLAAGGSKKFQEMGFNDGTPEEFYQWLLSEGERTNIPIEKDMVRAYAMRSGEMVDWLISIGVDFGKYNPDAYFHLMKDGSAPGTSIIPALAKQVESYKNIDYRFNTRATDILMNKGKAVGVKVTGAGGDYKINAKAVVIATGGFAYNEDLVVKYYGDEWVGRPTTGAKSATGDGILMAQRIGADTHNMNQVKANYLCYLLPTGDGVSLNAINPYIALVNHDGKRFVDESHPSIPHKSKEMMKQPKHEAYAIFDQQCPDNLKLIRDYNEAGYFITADSVEELAAKLDVNKANFIKTMNNYIEYGKTNKDKEFSRNIRYPLGGKKFYAALVTPSMQSTYGGIHTNTKAQVIDTKGKVIPGLYAAGAVSGHGSFGNEIGAQGIIAITYGRIAGENVVAELKK